MLQIEHLTKSFGSVTVLDHVSETFQAYAVHGLLGANGAGKSTLIKILSGFHPATSGAVLLDGRRVSFTSPKDAYLAGIRTIQQETDVNLFTSLTVLENIILRTETHGGLTPLVRKTDRERARSRLALVGGSDIPLSKQVAELPIAQRQQVALASALDKSARVLILDEPTAALDRRDAEQLLVVLGKIRDHGAAIIYVSHHLEEVVELANRITVLRGGAVVDRFEIPTSPDSKATQERLIAAMTGAIAADSVRCLSPHVPKAAQNSEPALLQVTDLVARSINGVSFTVRAGEVVVLSGLLGSGAGAVLKCIYGLQPVRAGKIEIEGRAIARTRPADMARRGLGLVPDDRQRLGLHLDESIIWNGTLPVFGALSGPLGFLNDTSLRPTAQRVAQRVRLVASRLTLPVRALSGGNQQKVVISKWLTARRKLILLHEPTRGVDVATRVQIYDLLRRLVREEGMGILCATYDFDEVLKLGDRIIIMNRGTFVWETTASAATEQKLMNAAVGG